LTTIDPRLATLLAGAKTKEDNAKTVFGRYRFEVLSLKWKDGNFGLASNRELKVVSAQKTQENEPSQVGAIVSLRRAAHRPLPRGEGEDVVLQDVPRDGRRCEGREPQLDGGPGEVLRQEQPLFGVYIDCEVYPKPMEAKGNRPAYVAKNHRWTTVPDAQQDAERIAKARAAAGLK
jgi:hypothetical protein